MKKGEYLRKRKEMVNQARAAIEKDDYETGEDLLYKVGVMDVEYEEEKQVVRKALKMYIDKIEDKMCGN